MIKGLIKVYYNLNLNPQNYFFVMWEILILNCMISPYYK